MSSIAARVRSRNREGAQTVEKWRQALRESSSSESSDSIASHVRSRRRFVPTGSETTEEESRSELETVTEESDYQPPPPRRSTRVRKQVIFSSESEEESSEPVVKKRRARPKKVEVETESDLESEYESEEVDEEDVWVVQNILGERDQFTQHVTDDEEEHKEKEYYVKFHGKAYIHCKWLSEGEVLCYEGGESALRRFGAKAERDGLSHSLSIPALLTYDESEVNSLWFKVDRVIDASGDGEATRYCVKWQGLGYDEVTWEKEEDIKDPEKIQAYLARLDRSNPRKIPSRWKRPKASAFEKIEEVVKAKDGSELRDYQMEGFNWLRFCWYNRRNSILADEMGLGKTAQIVTTLASFAEHEGIYGPFLIVAPLSTLEHWKNEFERWSNLNAIVYHGNSVARDVIKETEFSVVDEKGRVMPNRVQFDVVITNNTTIFKDFNVFAEIEWRYLVVDEAHSLKNADGKLYQKMTSLVFEHCTLLTGTPIQNNIKELWGLLHFMYPDRFDDVDAFEAQYGNTSDIEQVTEIQKIIQPIMLRRRKADVEASILPKVETIVQVELTRTQKKYYRAFLQENKATLLQQITGGALVSLQNLMMQLRKLCNHPYLINGAEDQIVREMRDQYQDTMSRQEIELKAMIESSGKMIFIDKLLPKLRAGGNKVLIFSQMVRVLDIIEDYLVTKGYPFERIDGSVSDSDRPRSIDRFNEDPNAFVFLLSTKAGGVGINLTAANTVIIFDSDWNPQNDNQAQARCHRIGQKDSVKVYRLITRDTYESKMFERASRKLALDHVVLDGGEMSKEAKPMKASEIEEILRHGVHGIFNDDDTEADNFCAADIDQILEKHATSMTEDVVTGGGSKFAKAVFNTDEHGLDMNSTDFWAKVMPMNDNSTSGPSIRRCRQERMELALAKEMTSGLGTIKRVLMGIIERGYRGSQDEVPIIEYAMEFVDIPSLQMQRLLFEILGKKDPKDEEEAAEIGAVIKEENEKYQGINGSEVTDLIEEKAEKLLERTIFFARLRRVLYFVQGSDFEWPAILPLWEGPVSEYALAVAVDRYGWRELTANIDDPELGLSQAKPLKKPQIESRLDDLMTAIEAQMPKDTLNAPMSFTPELPEKWKEAHPGVLSRSVMFEHEIMSEFRVLTSIGIPLDDDGDPNWSKIRDLAKLQIPNLESVRTVGEQLVKMAENANEEIKWDDYPLLEPVKDKIPLTKAKKLQSVLKELSMIHRFAFKLNPRRLEAMKKIERPASGPEWWTWECDRAMILSIDKFGLNKTAVWLIDPALPFRQNLPADLLETLVKAAEQGESKTKQKTFKPPADLSEDMSQLFRQRWCVSRAVNVIKAVRAALKKEVREKQREMVLAQKRERKEEEKRKKEEEKRQKEEEKKKRQEEKKMKASPSSKPGEIVTMPWILSKTLRITSLGEFDSPTGQPSFPAPVGFRSIRTYQIPEWDQPIDVQCDILRERGKLIFKTTVLNDPTISFGGDNPTMPWNLVLKHWSMKVSPTMVDQIIQTRRVVGPQLFGLNLPKVYREMLKMKNANQIASLVEFSKKALRKFSDIAVRLPTFQLQEAICQ